MPLIGTQAYEFHYLSVPLHVIILYKEAIAAKYPNVDSVTISIHEHK